MEKGELFKKFISAGVVLIVDKNPSSRVRLQKLIHDLGAKTGKVFSVKSLFEAREVLAQQPVKLVLCDYTIEGGSGFDLFKGLRASAVGNQQVCFILVTSNFSQAAVAKAAEEDVDSYIIKPYTLKSVEENLISTVQAKVQPSEYIQRIEAGKRFFQTEDYDSALAEFNKAIGLHPKPALALFYIGQTEYLRNQSDVSEIFNEGLAFNSIHFKCLSGLLETFLRDRRYHEAYQIAKKVAEYFPANHQRLKQVIRLAVRTENFKDMEMYYSLFTDLDERTPELINYVGAGLFVSGKYFLLQGETEVATKLFEDLLVSCAQFTKFTRAIISLMVEHQQAERAETYLKRFPAGFDDHEDYLVSRYLLSSQGAANLNDLVKSGLELFNRNIRDYQCLSLLAESMRAVGVSEDRVEPILEELERYFPKMMSA